MTTFLLILFIFVIFQDCHGFSTLMTLSIKNKVALNTPSQFIVRKPVALFTSTPSIGNNIENSNMDISALPSKGSKAKASAMLKKYGIAYLITSISLAIMSFTACYVMVSRGVDVAALLSKVGIKAVTPTSVKAGTFGIAYVFHKAASPIRFPPTVALTPFVARYIGKRITSDDAKTK